MKSSRTISGRRTASASALFFLFFALLLASAGAGPSEGPGRRLVATLVLPDGVSQEAAKRLLESDERILVAPHKVGAVTLMRVELTEARVAEISADPRVLRAFPWTPPRMHDERSGAVVTGAVDGAGRPTGAAYRAWLDEQGFGGPLDVTIDITDSGLDIGSDDVPGGFRAPDGTSRVVYNRTFTLEGGAYDLNGHGTINASIAAGSATGEGDAEGYSYGLGIAPAARLGSSRIFNDRGDFDLFAPYSDVFAPAWRDGARVSNNSWGGLSNLYDPDALEIDALVRDADPETPGAQEMILVFSAGNGGPGGTIDSPGTAKNVITVGAAEGVRPGSDGCGVGSEAADSAFDVAFFSSGGPVDDGRVKPDLLAPGTHVVGTRSRAEGYTGDGVCDPGFPDSPALYTWSSGTSHAAPAVSGAAALVYTRLRRERGAAPSPALVKAFLLNSTRYLAGAGGGDDLPSPRQGWGLLDLERALDDTARLVVDRGTPFRVGGDVREFTCLPVDPSRPVRVTLVWTDAPGSPGPAPAVNDLDLEVETNGGLYRGNRFARDRSTQGGDRDPRNNVEGVWLPAGGGPLRVRVRATSLVGDGVPGDLFLTDQDFALVAYNVRQAPAPLLRVVSSTVEAEDGGAPEPGGAADVHLTLANGGTAAAPADRVTLTAGLGVTVVDSADDIGALAPGATTSTARGFRIALDASVPCGASLGLEAHVGGLTIPIEARAGAAVEATVLDDDVEGQPRWTPSSDGGAFPWRISTERARSGTNSWHAPDAPVRQDATLVSDPINVPADAASASLAFHHTYEFEPGFDGGIVEISDGGPWEDLGPWMVSGRYPSNVSATLGSALGTRPVWSGGRLGDFTAVTVDLSGFVGRTVRLRFRATADSRTGAPGWFVDDIRVVVARSECSAPGGRLPTISSAVYKKGKLKIQGAHFDGDAVVEVNGRALGLPATFRPDKGLLKIKAALPDLNLKQPGSNRLVVLQNGRASRAYALSIVGKR
jgi:hypothetical protein